MKIYFIGIGGISMSALAKYLKLKGFDVLGSDEKFSKTLLELENAKIKTYIGKNLDAVSDSDIVVYTSAIKKENEELRLATKLNKVVYTRVELLNEIIKSFKNSIGVAGSHGKTTTTSMIAHIFKQQGESFTAHIGGEDGYFGNLYTDLNNKNFITEICEYKKNILNVSVSNAVILNVDSDHLDCYKDINELKNSFEVFLNKSNKKIVNADDAFLNNLDGVVTFGINNEANFMAKNLKQINGKYTFNLIYNNEYLSTISLKVVGLHNVYNALASVAVCYLNGISVLSIKCALENFRGVKRRFEFLKRVNNVDVYCDYCHHPTEIKSLIETSKMNIKGKILYIFEPHTYSRTKILLNDFISVFSGEDVVFYKTYPARESYDYLGSSEYLAKKLNAKHFDNFNYLINNLINKMQNMIRKKIKLG